MSDQLTSLLITLSLSTGFSVLFASMKSAYLSAGRNEGRRQLSFPGCGSYLQPLDGGQDLQKSNPTIGEQRLWKFTEEGLE